MYEGCDWVKKVESTLLSRFCGNADTTHGSLQEGKARMQYISDTRAKVIPCGLVVSAKNLWLACSPAGIVMDKGKPVKLLEIKCPTKGKTMCAYETALSCRYLEK